MKKIMLASIGVLFTWSAFAADTTTIEVHKAPPAAYYNWSGFYVGAHAGWSAARTEGLATFLNMFTDQKLQGWIGGAQVGVNHQIGRAVLGLEASGSWSNVTGSGDCFVGKGNVISNMTCSTTQDATAQLLGRFGYAPGDGRFFPYVLGGIALTRMKATKQFTFATSGPGAVPPNALDVNTTPWGQSAIHQGAVLGLGGQYVVWPGLSVGLDYLFTVYGVQDHGGQLSFTINSNFGGPFSSSGTNANPTPQNLTTHAVRFVVNYKLD